MCSVVAKERDFTHVYDVIDGIMQLLQRSQNHNMFILEGGNPKTVLEVTEPLIIP